MTEVAYNRSTATIAGMMKKTNGPGHSFCTPPPRKKTIKKNCQPYLHVCDFDRKYDCIILEARGKSARLVFTSVLRLVGAAFQGVLSQ